MPEEPIWLAVTLVRADTPGLPGGRGPLISIPKKTVRLATKRNRIRRVLREAIRGLEAPTGHVFRFRVTASPAEPSLESAKSELKNALVRADNKRRKTL